MLSTLDQYQQCRLKFAALLLCRCNLSTSHLGAHQTLTIMYDMLMLGLQLFCVYWDKCSLESFSTPTVLSHRDCSLLGALFMWHDCVLSCVYPCGVMCLYIFVCRYVWSVWMYAVNSLNLHLDFLYFYLCKAY